MDTLRKTSEVLARYLAEYQQALAHDNPAEAVVALGKLANGATWAKGVALRELERREGGE